MNVLFAHFAIWKCYGFTRYTIQYNTIQYNTAFIKRLSKHHSAEQKNKYKCKYNQKAKQIIYKQNISITIN